jgi:uncharacterized protein with HEPN domain
MTPPLEPPDLGRLGDIIAFGKRALRHLEGQSLQAFQADEKTQDSVVRCLAIVGEAAWKMSPETKAANPEIPWPLVASMRHRLVHDYGAINLATVHKVLIDDLPPLIAKAEAIFASNGGQGSSG